MSDFAKDTDVLISRQAAIEALEREKTFCTAYRDGYSPTNPFEKYNMGLSDGIKALKNLPTAQERKKGKWILFSPRSFFYSCSLCGQWSDREWNYCPNCGAEMVDKDINVHSKGEDNDKKRS